jgi:hypothetical protein
VLALLLLLQLVLVCSRLASCRSLASSRPLQLHLLGVLLLLLCCLATLLPLAAGLQHSTIIS